MNPSFTPHSAAPAPQARVRRLRRVQLAVPASNEKMMAKAAASAADHVFLDLEDAVSLNAKADARAKAVHALNTLDWGRKTRCVRINDWTTPYFLDDVLQIVEGARENLDVLMIPKVMNAADVYVVDVLLTQLETKHSIRKRIGIEVLIEEVEGLKNVEQIASSSPRLEALIFGMGDYSASQGIDMELARGYYPGDVWHYPRFRIAMAARCAGIAAVDGPYGDIANIAGYQNQCKLAFTLGMVGKWALHPTQIEPALDVFTPKQKDIDNTRAMMAAYSEAQERGVGAIMFNGAFIDVAVVRRAQNLLARAELLGM